MDPEDDVRDLVARWARAFTGCDLEGVLRLYAPDATFIGTSSAGFTIAPEQVRAYFVRALRDRTPLRAEILESTVQVFGSTAVVTALDRIEWSDPGHPRVSMGRVTFVLRHARAAWRIVSFHRSEAP